MNAQPRVSGSRPAPLAGPGETDMLLGASLACRFFGRIFQGPPEADVLRALQEQDMFADWPLPCESNEAREGLRLLGSNLARETPAAIGEDFAALFIGPADPLLQWESTWTTRERLLFGQPDQAVRECYARHGLAASGPEPADHISLELAFLGELLERGGEAEERGEALAAAALVAEARAFLAEHLALWAGPFLQELERRAATDFYRGAALLCGACLTTLQGTLFPRPAGRGPGHD